MFKSSSSSSSLFTIDDFLNVRKDHCLSSFALWKDFLICSFEVLLVGILIINSE